MARERFEWPGYVPRVKAVEDTRGKKIADLLELARKRAKAGWLYPTVMVLEPIKSKVDPQIQFNILATAFEKLAQDRDQWFDLWGLSRYKKEAGEYRGYAQQLRELGEKAKASSD